jgi:hypothetical protein
VKIVNDKLTSHGLTITLAEINTLKYEISDKSKINNNQKFYPKLKSLLKQKLGNPESFYVVDDSLPEKGKSSGTLLSGYIDNLSKVSVNITTAFKKLLEE